MALRLFGRTFNAQPPRQLWHLSEKCSEPAAGRSGRQKNRPRCRRRAGQVAALDIAQERRVGARISADGEARKEAAAEIGLFGQEADAGGGDLLFLGEVLAFEEEAEASGAGLPGDLAVQIAGRVAVEWLTVAVGGADQPNFER